jgi:hypothetical protein
MSQIIFTGGSGPTPGSAVETLTGDTGGPVSPTANNIDVVGGENINTAGNPGTSTITINLNETIHWDSTNGAGTTGAIYLGATGGVGGNRFMHNYSFIGASTFLGLNAGNFTNIASENSGFGATALTAISTGEANTGCGSGALEALVGGFNNSAFGDSALLVLETGDINNSSYNTALGCLAGFNLLTGSFNTLIGSGDGTTVLAAGQNLSGAESSNILINNPGLTGHSHELRIGVAGSGGGQINSAYIAGIFGVTVGASGTAVFVDNTGKLGTVVSSRRFKKDIEPITEESSEIFKLRPVSFHMISEKNTGRHIGLIAEEVEEHIPTMVIHDNDGKPFTVKYHELPILMLNELQKQNAIINSLVRRINLLEQTQGSYDEL